MGARWRGALRFSAVVAVLLAGALMGGREAGAAQAVTLSMPSTTVVHGGLYDTLVDTTGSIGPLSTDKTLPVGNAGPFRVGMIIQVESELMQVTLVVDLPSGPDSLTVLRGHAGTAIVSHALGRSIYRQVGMLSVNASAIAAEDRGTLETPLNSSAYELTGATLASGADGVVTRIMVSEVAPFYVDRTLLVDSEKMLVTGTEPGWLQSSGAVLAAGVSSSATSIPVSDQSLLSVGWTVKVENEFMTVTALTDGVPDTMTVTRGQLGSTAASHLTGKVIYETNKWLAAAIDDAVTTIPVTDQSLLAVGWTVMVDGELMTITALTDGAPDTMEVIRGANNSGASSHIGGAAIFGEPHELLVQRGYAGTSAAPHLQGAPVAEDVRTIDPVGSPAISVGSHLQVDAEKFVVLTGPDASGQVKALRAQLGSTAASHSAGATLADIDGFGAASVALAYDPAYYSAFMVESGALLTATGRSTVCTIPSNLAGSAVVECHTQGELPLGALGAGSALLVGMVTLTPTGLSTGTITLSAASASDTSGDGYAAQAGAPAVVNVVPCADFNSDYSVTGTDIAMIKARVGQTSSSPSWNPIFDLRPDGAVTGTDVAIAKLQFGIRCYRP